MGAEETKRDLLLKRTQVTVGILVGLVSLIVAVYNMKTNVLTDKSPGKISVTAVSEEWRKPVGSAHIDFMNSQSAIVASAMTNDVGQAIAQNLEPGSYAVKVTLAGYEPQLATVLVSPKRTTDVTLALRTLAPGQAQKGDVIRSAIEEHGASWIKNLGALAGGIVMPPGVTSIEVGASWIKKIIQPKSEPTPQGK